MNNIEIITTIVCSLASVLVALGTILGYVKKAVNNIVDDGVDAKIEAVKKDITNDFELSMVSLEQAIESLSKQIEEIHSEMIDIKRIQKDTTQSNARYIINEAHKLYIKQGWIDYYTLSALEDIFKTYSETGGNHFTADHMQDLRDLPNERPPRTKTTAKPKGNK